MGLLDTMQAQPQGGLLGIAPKEISAEDKQLSLQMALMLSKSPTPQTAQQVIAAFKQSGNPNADKLEQMIQSVSSNPQQLKAMADFVIQSTGGINAGY